MKAHYRAFGGRLVVEVEGSNIKDLFQQIGPIAQVLDGDMCCGKCQSPNIYPECRTAKGFDYYQLKCSDCGARLSFGQLKDGAGLFAKRDEHPDTRGWYLYLGLEAPQDPPEMRQEAPAPRPAASSNPTPAARAQSAQPATPPPSDMVLAMDTVETATAVFGKLCDRLRAIKGTQKVDELWAAITKACGLPQNGKLPREAILNRLWVEVVKIGA
jgi:hypothetical protein